MMWSKVGTTIHSPAANTPIPTPTPANVPQQAYAGVPDNLFEVKFKTKQGQSEAGIFEICPERFVSPFNIIGSIETHPPPPQF